SVRRARCSCARAPIRSKVARPRSCATFWASGSSASRASPASTATSRGRRSRAAEPLAMTDRAAVTAWVDAYERAWRTPGTDALARLFTDDATYSMDPYGETAPGLDAIAELWERERVSAEESFTMTYEVVAVEGDTAVVRVAVEYFDRPRQ